MKEIINLSSSEYQIAAIDFQKKKYAILENNTLLFYIIGNIPEKIFGLMKWERDENEYRSQRNCHDTATWLLNSHEFKSVDKDKIYSVPLNKEIEDPTTITIPHICQVLKRKMIRSHSFLIIGINPTTNMPIVFEKQGYGLWPFRICNINTSLHGYKEGSVIAEGVDPDLIHCEYPQNSWREKLKKFLPTTKK